MNNALRIFLDNINVAKENSTLHEFLSAQIRAPVPFDDLLRSQIALCVSALDKLLHDIITIGMVDIFERRRNPTKKYKCETISIEVHTNITSATIPPPAYLFQQEVVRKLSHLTFQDPDKIRDGLSLIWDEKHKWQKISSDLGEKEEDTYTLMKLISTRRNAIVHEADMNPLSGTKNPITLNECKRITNFIQRCGESIVNLVNIPRI